MAIKKCGKCNEDLPATLDYFYKHREGFLSICKSCKKQDSLEWYEGNKENILRRMKEHPSYNREVKVEYNKKRDDRFRKEIGISYRGLHNYIERNKIKPEFCQVCREWAKLELHSRDHKYTKDINDWLYVCKKCHLKLTSSNSESSQEE